MDIDESRIIARFQSLITGFIAAKQVGQSHAELTDEVYRTWLKLEQRGLKNTSDYRNVMSRADRHAWWLAGLARLSSPDRAASLFKRISVSIFWILVAAATTFKYRPFTYVPAPSPIPLDKEFAGSPAMPASGMAGHFVLNRRLRSARGSLWLVGPMPDHELLPYFIKPVAGRWLSR